LSITGYFNSWFFIVHKNAADIYIAAQQPNNGA
jgi:hypothetical protein